MPVKNTETFLRSCIKSILSQTYTDWELIAVDDHSNDASYEMLKRFAAQDSRITVLKNEGTGITPALKTGYKDSKGQFITRMDSDDIMPPNKLTLLHNQWQQKGRGYVVTGLVKYFADFPLRDGYKKYEEWLNQLTVSNSNFSEIYKECSIASPNWLIDRQDFDAAGAFDTEMYPEDYCLIFMWKQAGYKINSVNEVTHLWRDYSDRTSRTDDNYSDNRFTTLKVKYFIKLDYQKSQSLVLWGAGNKGKGVARELIDNSIPFRWVCENPKKIGLDIYGVIMENISAMEDLKEPQVIVAVSQKGAQETINEKLNNLKIKNQYYFC